MKPITKDAQFAEVALISLGGKTVADLWQKAMTGMMDLFQEKTSDKIWQYMVQRVTIINPDIPLLVSMPYNPEKMTTNLNKIYNETITANAIIYEHWGEKPQVLSFSGVSLPRLGNNFIKAEVTFNMFKQMFHLDKMNVTGFSAVFAQLDKNHAFTTKNDTSLTTTLIYHNGTLYEGFFTTFDFTEDANSPYLFTYNINFIVTWSSEVFFRDLLFKVPDMLIQKPGIGI